MEFKFLQTISRALGSEHVVDALRNTFAVVLPIVIFLDLGWPTTAIGIGIGALMICMTDLPGNRGDKFKTAWISILVFTAIAILTAATTSSTVLMIAFVVSITFILTMWSMLGQRFGAIGLMGIVLATFTIGLRPKDPLLYGNYIFIGGVWYYLISLSQIYVFPYRSLTRAINQTVRDTAELIKLRGSGYNPEIDLSGFNQRNIRLHLKLANQHELIRQLLLGDKRAMRQFDKKAKVFLERSINLIDLYEQVSAVHHEYPFLRKTFAETGVLPLIEESASLLAKKLTLANDRAADVQFQHVFSELQHNLSQLSHEQAALLRQILANVKEINALIDAIHQPKVNTVEQEDPVRHHEFLTSAPAPATAIKQHFSLRSPIFRFALRLSVLCLVALVVVTVLSEKHYTYWLLLTMILVSRPSYGQTVRRNLERLIGTTVGLIVGWGVIAGLSPETQLIISVIALFGFFALNRVFYAACVVCITVAVIICLNRFNGDLWQLMSQRAVFTIAGVLLCLAATFLFPIWNALRLSNLIGEVLKANLLYFESVIQSNPSDLNTLHQARLARKYSHQQLSALSEAIQATKTEPLGKRINWQLVKRIQLLDFQFNVLTATFSGIQKQGRQFLSPIEIKAIIGNLQRSLDLVGSIDLYGKKELPLWREQPMNLVEVSGHLAEVLDSSNLEG